jgi:hypothetical protein
MLNHTLMQHTEECTKPIFVWGGNQHGIYGHEVHLHIMVIESSIQRAKGKLAHFGAQTGPVT